MPQVTTLKNLLGRGQTQYWVQPVQQRPPLDSIEVLYIR